jgi:hypothetical protein
MPYGLFLAGGIGELLGKRKELVRLASCIGFLFLKEPQGIIGRSSRRILLK